ncbi:MAG: hypothetical protein RLN76_08230 [Phycisphaeraceae bacterium]
MKTLDTLVPLNDENVRKGWAELLSRYRWDVFATLTYANPVWESEKVLRDFRRWLWKWQVETAVERGLAVSEKIQRRDGYGRTRSAKEKVSGSWHNSYRKGRGRPIWVLGVEQHKSGSLHAHAVLRWSDQLPDLCRKLGWDLWVGFRHEGGYGHGYARLEPPRGQDDVASYVSKYVTKGGEIFIAPSFTAPRLAAAS